jgi:Putative Ig domain
MTVAPGLSVTTTYLPPARVGAGYTALLTSVGGVQPIGWSLADDSTDVLPPGLSIDSDGQALLGTPTIPGVFHLKLEATDAAGISATAQVTLTVATEVGGLLPIGRRVFGGTSADWVGRFVGDVWDRAPFAVVTFWNDQVAGAQYTDLETIAGLAITYITADSYGEFGQFQGPEGVLSMWADANDGSGPRRLIECADKMDLVRNIWTALAELAGGG